ncbi:hypothetical protein [Haloferula sp. BvORR071]|uniref:hypothetical protein n=1 Tax=Haloferula sp. BvORR071 TaxID=1396141 RepID=UPI00054E7AEE|nr:hypothetical protein [Haloferula sp. BvORR071]
MNSKTAWWIGGQLLSLAVIGGLWSELRDLKGRVGQEREPGGGDGPSPAKHGAARVSASDASGEGAAARSGVSPERRAAAEKAKSGPAVSQTGGRPRVESTPDGGVVFRWPGGGRSLALTPEELTGFEQDIRAARMEPFIKKPGGPSWSPGQAAGAPDTATHGDFATAWASQSQDGGKEWLQLKYAGTTEIGEVVVHESYNPGAISRVVAMMPDGGEQVLWEGTQDPGTAGQARNSSFTVPPGISSDQIRVEMDTARVPGWNEIDAVELVGRDGKRQWATESTASSYYGEGRALGATAYTSQEILLDLPEVEKR